MGDTGRCGRLGRYAIFVDAGFLWASVGESLFDTSERSRLTCNYETMLSALIDHIDDDADRELLRVYWYDGAVNKVPTPDQKRVGLLPDTKLRLGRIVAGHQKGVDSLIVLDLLRLASSGRVDQIYLLSGDDDLSEGVREAQALGVRVLLVGVESRMARHSEAMVLEADGVELLPRDFWAEHFRFVGPPDNTGYGDASGDLANHEAVVTYERVGHAFAARWIEESPPEEVVRVLRSRPRVPGDLDAKLLWDTSAGKDLSEGERVALRDGFWRAFNGLAAPVVPDDEPPRDT